MPSLRFLFDLSICLSFSLSHTHTQTHTLSLSLFLWYPQAWRKQLLYSLCTGIPPYQPSLPHQSPHTADCMDALERGKLRSLWVSDFETMYIESLRPSPTDEAPEMTIICQWPYSSSKVSTHEQALNFPLWTLETIISWKDGSCLWHPYLLITYFICLADAFYPKRLTRCCVAL